MALEPRMWAKDARRAARAMLMAMLIGAWGCGESLPEDHDGAAAPPDASAPDLGDGLDAHPASDADLDAAGVDSDAGPHRDPDAGEARDLGPDVAPALHPTLAVSVVDRAGFPIDGARITVGDASLLTDAVGRARTTVAPGVHVVQVAAAGFAGAAEAVRIERDGDLLLTLLDLAPPVSFDPGAGVDTEVDGVRVEVPPGVVVDADGRPVEGPVGLTVTAVDPTAEGAIVPGPQRGEPEDGEPVELSSVFMAEVSLWRAGERLRVAEGETIRLSFPVPKAWTGALSPGDTVPAWWFDEARAVWREEGRGTVVEGEAGLVWQVDVGHLTWWNCDVPRETTRCLRARVVDESGDPVPGSTIIFRAPEEGYRRLLFAGDDGTACVETPDSTRVLASARLATIGSPAREVVLGDDGPRGTCGSGPCATVDLVIPEPGCVRIVISEPESETRALMSGSGTSPTAVPDGDDGACRLASVGTSIDVTPTGAGGRPNHLARRSVPVERPGDCSAPETCVRVEVDPVPIRTARGLSLGFGTLCHLGDAGRAVCYGNVNLTPPPSDLGRRFKRIATGQTRVCGVDRAGAVECVGVASSTLWSDIESGVVVPRLTPLDWAPPALDVGLQTWLTCVLTAERTVLCRSHVNRGPPAERTLVGPDDEPVGPVARMDVGYDAVCALDEAGDVWCSGRGIPAATRLALPEPAVDIAAGESLWCALLASGQVWCRGREMYAGQGTGNDAPFAEIGPVLVAPDTPLEDIARIDMGDHALANQTCALSHLGAVWCWGDGAIGAEVDRDGRRLPGLTRWATPVDWSDFETPPTVVDVVTDTGRTCAELVGGRAVCWGAAMTERDAAGEVDALTGMWDSRRRPHPDDVFILESLADR